MALGVRFFLREQFWEYSPRLIYSRNCEVAISMGIVPFNLLSPGNNETFQPVSPSSPVGSREPYRNKKIVSLHSYLDLKLPTRVVRQLHCLSTHQGLLRLQEMQSRTDEHEINKTYLTKCWLKLLKTLNFETILWILRHCVIPIYMATILVVTKFAHF